MCKHSFSTGLGVFSGKEENKKSLQLQRERKSQDKKKNYALETKGLAENYSSQGQQMGKKWRQRKKITKFIHPEASF